MRRGGAKTKSKKVATPASPINFRMPPTLRSRLRKYATTRHIGEAQALRVVVSEHLDEVESQAELSAAERWQYEQAYATWDAFLRGEDDSTVSREEIQRIFARALAPSQEHASGTA